MERKVTVKSLLTRARLLISDKSRWTPGAQAKDAQGNEVKFSEPSACRFDARGAVLKMAHVIPGADAAGAIRLLEDVANSMAEDRKDPLGYVNDTLGHDSVLQVYDLAIQQAKVGS